MTYKVYLVLVEYFLTPPEHPIALHLKTETYGVNNDCLKKATSKACNRISHYDFF